MRSGRQSLGGQILRDSNTNRLSSLRSPSPSIAKRRVSFGGSGSAPLFTPSEDSSAFNVFGSVEPKKDRRTMLEEWRAQKMREKESAGGNASGRATATVNTSLSAPSHVTLDTGTSTFDHQHDDKENYRRTCIESSLNHNNHAQTSGAAVPPASAALPLPPSSEGTTALERFRMRKKMREMEQHQHYQSKHAPLSLNSDNCSVETAPTVASSSVDSNHNHTRASTICFDDDDDFGSATNTGRNTGASNSTSGRKSILTPMINRRKSFMPGGARRRIGNSRGGRRSLAPGSVGLTASLSTNSNPPPTPPERDHVSISSMVNSSAKPTSLSAHLPLPPSASTTTITNTSISTDTHHASEIDNTDSDLHADQPGMRSRLVLMEQRIQELEKEKMALAMSKAPLEARLRQKEDQWMKDQAKYEQEINALMTTSKEETERFKSVENELEEIQGENRRLRLDLRKQTLGLGNANSSAESSFGQTDNWNRRLQNDRDVQEYKDKLRAAEEEIKALRLEKVSIETEINATNIEMSALMRDFDALQEEFDELQAQKDSNGEAEIQLEELTKEHTATLALLNATSGELVSLRSQSKFEMEKKEKEWQDEKERMMFEMSVLKTRAANNDYDDDMSADSEDEAVLRARIEERDRRIEQLEAEVLKGEQIRREMHNTIQELRGNIRVFVRTRPFLPGDNGSTSSSLDFHPDGENLAIETKGKIHDFKFDKIFAPSSGQDAVFDEVSEFVQSALDGYHVCLFSYGQTGSGKTHTMQGSGSGAMRGIIPRAVEQILNQAKSMQEQKWKFTISASFLEIYNEELKDLLASMNEGVITKPTGVATRNQKQNKLAIRRERDGKSYVAGLKKIQINTENANEGMKCLKNLMTYAGRARSVASTKMNAVSSRSHSVFMLHLNGINEENGTVVEGALNLCDLAGSERLDRSGAGSDAKRLKETQAINKSLSCLGDVFTSLSNGSSHVPFRNSKLTYLLQDCLSGDGKALMFVNLSPTLQSSGESLCSLRFAQRVNQVELGKATKHVSYSSKAR